MNTITAVIFVYMNEEGNQGMIIHFQAFQQDSYFLFSQYAGKTFSFTEYVEIYSKAKRKYQLYVELL